MKQKTQNVIYEILNENNLQAGDSDILGAMCD